MPFTFDSPDYASIGSAADFAAFSDLHGHNAALLMSANDEDVESLLALSALSPDPFIIELGSAKKVHFLDYCALSFSRADQIMKLITGYFSEGSHPDIRGSSLPISIISREMEFSFGRDSVSSILSKLLEIHPDYWRHSMSASDLPSPMKKCMLDTDITINTPTFMFMSCRHTPSTYKVDLLTGLDHSILHAPSTTGHIIEDFMYYESLRNTGYSLSGFDSDRKVLKELSKIALDPNARGGYPALARLAMSGGGMSRGVYISDVTVDSLDIYSVSASGKMFMDYADVLIATLGDDRYKKLASACISGILEHGEDSPPLSI